MVKVRDALTLVDGMPVSGAAAGRSDHLLPDDIVQKVNLRGEGISFHFVKNGLVHFAATPVDQTYTSVLDEMTEKMRGKTFKQIQDMEIS